MANNKILDNNVYNNTPILTALNGMENDKTLRKLYGMENDGMENDKTLRKLYGMENDGMENGKTVRESLALQLSPIEESNQTDQNKSDSVSPLLNELKIFLSKNITFKKQEKLIRNLNKNLKKYTVHLLNEQYEKPKFLDSFDKIPTPIIIFNLYKNPEFKKLMDASQIKAFESLKKSLEKSLKKSSKPSSSQDNSPKEINLSKTISKDDIFKEYLDFKRNFTRILTETYILSDYILSDDKNTSQKQESQKKNYSFKDSISTIIEEHNKNKSFLKKLNSKKTTEFLIDSLMKNYSETGKILLTDNDYENFKNTYDKETSIEDFRTLSNKVAKEFSKNELNYIPNKLLNEPKEDLTKEDLDGTFRFRMSVIDNEDILENSTTKLIAISSSGDDKYNGLDNFKENETLLIEVPISYSASEFLENIREFGLKNAMQIAKESLKEAIKEGKVVEGDLYLKKQGIDDNSNFAIYNTEAPEGEEFTKVTDDNNENLKKIFEKSYRLANIDFDFERMQPEKQRDEDIQKNSPPQDVQEQGQVEQLIETSEQGRQKLETKIVGESITPPEKVVQIDSQGVQGQNKVEPMEKPGQEPQVPENKDGIGDQQPVETPNQSQPEANQKQPQISEANQQLGGDQKTLGDNILNKKVPEEKGTVNDSVGLDGRITTTPPDQENERKVEEAVSQTTQPQLEQNPQPQVTVTVGVEERQLPDNSVVQDVQKVQEPPVNVQPDSIKENPTTAPQEKPKGGNETLETPTNFQTTQNDIQPPENQPKQQPQSEPKQPSQIVSEPAGDKPNNLVNQALEEGQEDSSLDTGDEEEQATKDSVKSQDDDELEDSQPPQPPKVKHLVKNGQGQENGSEPADKLTEEQDNLQQSLKGGEDDRQNKVQTGNTFSSSNENFKIIFPNFNSNNPTVAQLDQSVARSQPTQTSESNPVPPVNPPVNSGGQQYSPQATPATPTTQAETGNDVIPDSIKINDPELLFKKTDEILEKVNKKEPLNVEQVKLLITVGELGIIQDYSPEAFQKIIGQEKVENYFKEDFFKKVFEAVNDINILSEGLVKDHLPLYKGNDKNDKKVSISDILLKYTNFNIKGFPFRYESLQREIQNPKHEEFVKGLVKSSDSGFAKYIDDLNKDGYLEKIDVQGSYKETEEKSNENKILDEQPNSQLTQTNKSADGQVLETSNIKASDSFLLEPLNIELDKEKTTTVLKKLSNYIDNNIEISDEEYKLIRKFSHLSAIIAVKPGLYKDKEWLLIKFNELFKENKEYKTIVKVGVKVEGKSIIFNDIRFYKNSKGKESDVNIVTGLKKYYDDLKNYDLSSKINEEYEIIQQKELQGRIEKLFDAKLDFEEKVPSAVLDKIANKIINRKAITSNEASIISDLINWGAFLEKNSTLDKTTNISIVKELYNDFYSKIKGKEVTFIGKVENGERKENTLNLFSQQNPLEYLETNLENNHYYFYEKFARVRDEQEIQEVIDSKLLYIKNIDNENYKEKYYAVLDKIANKIINGKAITSNEALIVSDLINWKALLEKNPDLFNEVQKKVINTLYPKVASLKVKSARIIDKVGIVVFTPDEEPLKYLKKSESYFSAKLVIVENQYQLEQQQQQQAAQQQILAQQQQQATQQQAAQQRLQSTASSSSHLNSLGALRTVGETDRNFSKSQGSNRQTNSFKTQVKEGTLGSVIHHIDNLIGKFGDSKFEEFGLFAKQDFRNLLVFAGNFDGVFKEDQSKFVGGSNERMKNEGAILEEIGGYSSREGNESKKELLKPDNITKNLEKLKNRYSEISKVLEGDNSNIKIQEEVNRIRKKFDSDDAKNIDDNFNVEKILLGVYNNTVKFVDYYINNKKELIKDRIFDENIWDPIEKIIGVIQKKLGDYKERKELKTLWDNIKGETVITTEEKLKFLCKIQKICKEGLLKKLKDSGDKETTAKETNYWIDNYSDLKILNESQNSISKINEELLQNLSLNEKPTVDPRDIPTLQDDRQLGGIK